MAEALARHTGHDATVVDFACGTGLSGLALAAAWFTAIDGCDVSPGMLEIAGTTVAYRELILGDPDQPLPFRVGDTPPWSPAVRSHPARRRPGRWTR